MICKAKWQVGADQLDVEVVAFAIAAIPDKGDFTSIGGEDRRYGIARCGGDGDGAEEFTLRVGERLTARAMNEKKGDHRDADREKQTEREHERMAKR